ncbi:hypothetical protein ACEN32_12505 [Marinilactibacillus psychrotolerans]
MILAIITEIIVAFKNRKKLEN